jgi:hypothetical protein
MFICLTILNNFFCFIYYLDILTFSVNSFINHVTLIEKSFYLLLNKFEGEKYRKIFVKASNFKYMLGNF